MIREASTLRPSGDQWSNGSRSRSPPSGGRGRGHRDPPQHRDGRGDRGAGGPGPRRRRRRDGQVRESFTAGLEGLRDAVVASLEESRSPGKGARGMADETSERRPKPSGASSRRCGEDRGVGPDRSAPKISERVDQIEARMGEVEEAVQGELVDAVFDRMQRSFDRSFEALVLLVETRIREAVGKDEEAPRSAVASAENRRTRNERRVHRASAGRRGVTHLERGSHRAARPRLHGGDRPPRGRGGAAVRHRPGAARRGQRIAGAHDAARGARLEPRRRRGGPPRGGPGQHGGRARCGPR